MVWVNGKGSKSFDIIFSAPQDCVLGSLLFLLFIEDIPFYVQNSHCRLYADDAVLGMVVTECGESELQRTVSALYKLFIRWGMHFNI